MCGMFGICDRVRIEQRRRADRSGSEPGAGRVGEWDRVVCAEGCGCTAHVLHIRFTFASSLASLPLPFPLVSILPPHIYLGPHANHLSHLQGGKADSPLDASPANHELSQPRDEGEGGAERSPNESDVSAMSCLSLATPRSMQY